MKRKLFTFLVLFLGLFLLFGTKKTLAASSLVKSVEYDGDGKVDVEFAKYVTYKNAKVKVTDSAGKSYKVSIIEKDEDDLDFRIKNPAAGKKYTFRISGIKARSAKKYTTVKGTFKIPAADKVVIKKIEYDKHDKEVSFEFVGKVTFKKGVKVKITDKNGNKVKKIDDYDSDEIEVKVKTLTAGQEYNYEIKGVKVKGTSGYKTVKGTFTP